MKLFADSGFLIGLIYPNDERHNIASAIWEKLLEKGIISGYEDFYISNYVLVEIFHNLQKNIHFRETLRNYNELKSCKIFQIKSNHVEEAIHTKLRPFCNHSTGNPAIGLVDATSLFIMDKVKLTFILSFDDGFDHYPLYLRIGNVEDIEQKIRIAPL